MFLAGIHDEQAFGYPTKAFGYDKNRYLQIPNRTMLNTIAQTAFFESEVHINVFNISKINAETRGGRLPRIKRLSEYLGDSYFNYLSNLDDLVLLMDESHHYRADRGMQVINELNPILGLELTATPQGERSGGAIKFKNVVFEYSLAKAIQDGFVKEPAVATRRDFDPSQYSADELDRIKLEDGIRIHEDTKVALDIYARDNKVKPVKPFVLVVAQDTTHAGKLKHLIISNAFFEGNYADKVMEIHSNQSGEEKEENIEKLISWENPENKIEQEKAQAALQYCNYATEFTIQNGGKPWKYILIPHNAVMVNMSFLALAMKYEYQNG